MTHTLHQFLRITLFIGLCYTGLPAFAQIPGTIWDKTLGGTGSEYVQVVVQTSDGGYLCGGYSNSGISGDKSQASQGISDYWVVKVSSTGAKEWDKTFGGTGTDQLYSLQQTTDGGYILGGLSESGISGDKTEALKGSVDYWVVKISSDGVKEWDKGFGGTGPDYLQTLRQTSDGGYMLAGISQSGIGGDKTQASKGNSDYWVVKISNTGTKEWDKTFGGNSADILLLLQQTTDGGYMLGGYSQSGLSGDKTQASKGGLNDYWIVKISSEGIKEWDMTFGGDGYDQLYSFQQTSDGGYLLGGYSNSGISGDKTEAPKGGFDIWVVKISSSGTIEWDKTIGGSGSEHFYASVQTSDDGYILAGSSTSGISGDKTEASKGSNDYWLVKISGTGVKDWDKSFGGSGSDQLYSFQKTSDGGYILAGLSDSGISGDKTEASQGSYDYWMVHINTMVTSTKDAENGVGLNVYPNPNNGECTLQLSGFQTEKAELVILDITGRKVLSKELKLDSTASAETVQLPKEKGIYLLQIKTNTQYVTRKIVVE